jgi:hypothetical protein
VLVDVQLLNVNRKIYINFKKKFKFFFNKSKTLIEMGKQDINNPLRDYVLTFFKTKLFNLASIKDSSVVLFEKKLNVTSNTPLDLVGKSLLDFKLFLLPNDFSVNKFPNKNFNKNYNFFFF